MRWAAQAILAVVAALAAPVDAGAGVFRIGDLPAYDVAMLPDGSMALAGGPEVALRAPDGTLTPLTGFQADGIAAAPDGSLLGISGSDNVVRRWTPGRGVQVVAAAGLALESIEPQTYGVAATADGGFVLTDTGNDRVLVVDRAGAVRTLAVLPAPTGIAVAPGGDYVVADGAGVSRVRPDGAKRRISRNTSLGDIAVASDGSAIVSDAYEPLLWRVAPGAHRARPYLRARGAAPFDFANRTFGGEGVGSDGRGGILVADDLRGLTYITAGPTPVPLVALRDTRVTRHAVTAVIEATQPGTATLDVVRHGGAVAHAEAAVGPGLATLRAAGAIPGDWLEVRVGLRTAGGVQVEDTVTVHGARKLTRPLLRRMLGRDQGDRLDSDHLSLGRRCHRFGARRIDCEVRRDEDGIHECSDVASVTLGRTGIVLRREYACGNRDRARFRRHPHFLHAYGVRTLSRHEHGRWEIS